MPRGRVLYVQDYKPGRRLIPIKLRAPGYAAPATAETGLVSMRRNEGAWFTVHDAGGDLSLTAVDAPNGLYELQLLIADAYDGTIYFKYKTATTELWTDAYDVEPLPWVDSGVAVGGGATYIDIPYRAITVGGTLQAVPKVAQGSVVTLHSGGGAPQMAFVKSYDPNAGAAANPKYGRLTIEDGPVAAQGWQTAIGNPAADTVYSIRHGPPPSPPISASMDRILGRVAPAENLADAADTQRRATVVPGTLTASQITTDVAFSAATAFRNQQMRFQSGPLVDQAQFITAAASANGGVNTLFTVEPFPQAPAVGDKLVIV